MASWSAEFEFPVVADGQPLQTLSDARDYILNLPRSKQSDERWMTAADAVIMAAEGRGPMMHAHIGMNQAIAGPKAEALPRPGAKKTKWTRPKPKRDQ